MEAVIINFRRGRHTQNNTQMVIKVQGTDSREAAEKLVGKTVSWESPAKKQIKGTILAPHGNSGAVRAKFEKGMPGEAIAATVKIG